MNGKRLEQYLAHSVLHVLAISSNCVTNWTLLLFSVKNDNDNNYSFDVEDYDIWGGKWWRVYWRWSYSWLKICSIFTSTFLKWRWWFLPLRVKITWKWDHGVPASDTGCCDALSFDREGREGGSHICSQTHKWMGQVFFPNSPALFPPQVLSFPKDVGSL